MKVVYLKNEISNEAGYIDPAEIKINNLTLAEAINKTNELESLYSRVDKLESDNKALKQVIKDLTDIIKSNSILVNELKVEVLK